MSIAQFAAGGGGVDPLKVPLEELARIRGSMWTARYPLPWGPRPFKDDNILSLMDASISLHDEGELEKVYQVYLNHHYTHAVIGPVGNPPYHGQYPIWPDFRQNPDAYWDILQDWWDRLIKPVVFIKPDNWMIDQLETLTPFYSTAQAQRLCRIVVIAWEPSKDTPNAEWVRWAQWLARVFPNSLRLIHLPADFDAPGNNDDFTSKQPKYIGMAEAWNRVTPYLHGFLNQVGGYVNGSSPIPTTEFLNEFRKLFDPNEPSSLTNRFGKGYAGWPTSSAWGVNKPLRVFAAEYAAYGDYWKNFPESEAIKLGDFAMAHGAAGYLDGGSVNV